MRTLINMNVSQLFTKPLNISICIICACKIFDFCQMAKKKNTGLIGAGGISPLIKWYGVPVIRPMLSFTKSQILLSCFKKRILYLVDPSNLDDRFERVRERKNLEKLDQRVFSLKNFDRMSFAIRQINKKVIVIIINNCFHLNLS